MTRLRRSLRRAGRGTSAIEFAVVAPVLMLLFVATIEFARLFWTQAALQYALDRAARCAAVTPLTCTALTTPGYASSQVAGLAIPAADFTYATAACGYQISASVPFAFLVPSLMPFSLTLTATSCHPQ